MADEDEDSDGSPVEVQPPPLKQFSSVYYNAKQPTLLSLYPLANPAVLVIFKQPEFWSYIIVHMALCGLLIYDWIEIMPIDWKAAGAFQYFTTFFLTFYNANCFARYEKFYKNCTSILDGITLFVRELTICFKEQETWQHRLQATKYLLASADLFFFSVCGHKLTVQEWEECVKKGLLTKAEAKLLVRYQGPEVVPILVTWAMIVVTDALTKDCFHMKEKVQKIAHNHNRLDVLKMQVMHHYRNVAELLAFPIPYAYWHLMNLVFTLNFWLLALQLADFRHWMTVLPFTMALTTFMGLREVSNQLADPFGEDIVDFPLSKYLDSVFDDCISLVEGFSSEHAYQRTRDAIYNSVPFNEHQMRHQMIQEMLYSKGYQAHVDGLYIWERDTPLQTASENEDDVRELQERLRTALTPEAYYGDEVEQDRAKLENSAEWQRLRNQELTGDVESLERKVLEHEEKQAKAKENQAQGTLAIQDVKDATASPAKADATNGDSAKPLARPSRYADGTRRSDAGDGTRRSDAGRYQWGPSGDDAASDSSRRPRRPHKTTGDGGDRSFRASEVKSFDDQRRQFHSKLDAPGGSRPPSDAGSKGSNGPKSGSQARPSSKGPRKSVRPPPIQAVPEDSRV